MKMVKKIIALLMVAVLSLGFTTQAFALSNENSSADDLAKIIEENFGYMLNSVLREAESYDIAVEDFEEFSILNPVTFNSTDDEESDAGNIFHFPVADKNGKICLIYDVILTENGYSTTIGRDFAPLLDSVYEKGTSTVLLVQGDYTFYAVDSMNGYTQIGSNVDSMSTPEYESFSINTCTADEMTVSTLTENDTYSTAAMSSFETCVTDRIESYSSTITGTNILSNYPIVDQRVDGTQYGLCWAATVASIVRFEKPSEYGNLTAKDVADYMGIDYDEGGTNSESKKALAHYLGDPYVPTIKGVLSQSDIKTVIDNVDPAFMQGRRSKGFLSYEYHAVAMFGYDFTSSYTRIKIMDPAYECYKWCSMDSDEDWTFAFGSYTYTWIKTIRLLYST